MKIFTLKIGKYLHVEEQDRIKWKTAVKESPMFVAQESIRNSQEMTELKIAEPPIANRKNSLKKIALSDLHSQTQENK